MLRPLIARHPAIAFVALACGWSWLVGWPIQMALAHAAMPSDLARLYAMRLPIVAGPALAAWWVATACGGTAEGQAWLRSLWPRPVAWSFASGCAAVVLLTGVFAMLVTDPVWSGEAVFTAWPLLLAHLVGQIVVVGVLEEAGWRGWLLLQLLRRHRPLSAALLTTAGWVLWHLPVLWVAGWSSALSLLMLCAPLSLLLCAVYLRSHSVLACALVHGAANTPLFFLASVAPTQSPTAAMAVASLLYAALAAALWPRQA